MAFVAFIGIVLQAAFNGHCFVSPPYGFCELDIFGVMAQIPLSVGIFLGYRVHA